MALTCEGILTFSPHGSFLVALLIKTVGDYGITSIPPIGATISFMICETVAMMFISYAWVIQSFMTLQGK